MASLLALIVEDDPQLAIIFERALKEADFKTEIVRNGRDAITRLATMLPDVVILDLHLPQISGREILHHIRSDERLKQTRVMIASADPLMAETLRHEADLVLIKPVSFTQLRDLAIRLSSTKSR